MCGPDPVDSPCRMVYGVAAALLAFSVRCGLFLSFPYRRWAVSDGDFMRWRRLLAAVARLRSASIAQQSGLVRVDVPIQPGRVVSWRQVVWLASMSQSDQPELFELC